MRREGRHGRSWPDPADFGILQQVGSYQTCTGRDVDAVAKAALDPKQNSRPAVSNLHEYSDAKVVGRELSATSIPTGL